MKTFHLTLLLLLVCMMSCQDERFNFEEQETEVIELRATDASGVELYNYPVNEAPVSKYFEVKYNNTSYYVYPVPLVGVRPSAACSQTEYRPEIVSFGISNSGQATFKITSKNGTRFTSSNFVVRPKRQKSVGGLSNFTTSIASDGSLLLTVKGPQTLSVELQGNIRNPLLVFANPIETETITSSTPNVHYFGPGTIHRLNGRFTVGTGKTVYIAPGAIVIGTFMSENSSNVHIKGRGILSGENSPGVPLIEFRKVTGSNSINGITLVNSRDWVIPLRECYGTVIDGIRIASITGEEDGIDIIGSEQITVKNSFIWTKDDCIAIKAGVDYRGTGVSGTKSVKNIYVNNCVIWNGQHGNALEIGRELHGGMVENVYYTNIDIIHAENPCGQDEGALSINNNGNGVVRNIYYTGIYIEHLERYFMNIKVGKHPNYSPGGTEFQGGTYTGGHVYDIYYQNIHLTQGTNNPIHSAFIADSNLGCCIVNPQFSYLYINNIQRKHYVSEVSDATKVSGQFVLAGQGVCNLVMHQ